MSRPDPYAAARALTNALEDAAGRARAAVDGHPEFLAVLDRQTQLREAAQLALVAAEALEELMSWVIADSSLAPGSRSELEAGRWAEMTYDPGAPDASPLGFVARPPGSAQPAAEGGAR